MNVGAKPRVISKIPAVVVWVVIDNHRVSIPAPVISKVVIVWRDAEVEAAKPETLSVPSLKAEHVAASEATREAPTFPGMIDLVVGINTARIMSDPRIVCVNVGSVWMSSLVCEAAV